MSVLDVENCFWPLFAIATALKTLLIPAYHSTDFEVHRNWLAITSSLPLNRWYVDATSEWTLDYPPFFAYFEWLLAQVARHVDANMLVVSNLNYCSEKTKYFQRISVIIMDIVYAWGVQRCLRALGIKRGSQHYFAGSILLLLNVGLIFVDHIHFQYNGLLFGILLLAISYLLEGNFVTATFLFASLLNFKHIFLYIAPAFGVYILKFYCLQQNNTIQMCVQRVLKVAAVGLLPFVLSFGPFWRQLPQVLSRLFPFKRGLTHAYWAPNFWAVYNTVDKFATIALRVPHEQGATTSSGLVQEFKHIVLPNITPLMTFALTLAFMLPILVKLFFYTSKSDSKVMFLRSLILCSCASFIFGWHVHEKAILMCLIPLTLLCVLHATDAKYAFLLSVPGYFSLFPLLFHVDLLLVRYSLYLAYMALMYAQIVRMHKITTTNHHLHITELAYTFGFVGIPLYEHCVSRLLGLHVKLPFLPLLLTSFYCSLGVLYFFVRYYLYTLNVTLLSVKTDVKIKSKNKTKAKAKTRSDVVALLQQQQQQQHQHQQQSAKPKTKSASTASSSSSALLKPKMK